MTEYFNLPQNMLASELNDLEKMLEQDFMKRGTSYDKEKEVKISPHLKVESIHFEGSTAPISLISSYDYQQVEGEKFKTQTESSYILEKNQAIAFLNDMHDRTGSIVMYFLKKEQFNWKILKSQTIARC